MEAIDLFQSFPYPWASDWGEDESGIWFGTMHEGVRLGFRWIEPGTFLMGSPEDEPGRWDGEGPRHQVTLSRGFWMAETTCTQALWQAVMGENPSRFKGPDLPIENVSWHDVTRFLDKLNGARPELALRLPTEAEWEYACRVGTNGPFSFGEQITTEQVNYDGNHPYHGGEKGEYRERTVPVKSLPANAWGLYQMHGNVWEWCSDWYSKYPSDPATDPTGPDNGGKRVLRGGSWFGSGWDARSAYRDHAGPGSRDFSTGFRPARGL